MFHNHLKKAAMIVAALSLSLLPVASFAKDASSQAAQPELVPTQLTTSGQQNARLKDMSFQDIRRETKAKLTSTRSWAKNHQVPQDIKYFIDDVETATDRFQDRVSPAGRSIKSFVSKKMPGKRLAHQSDRSLTVFGVLLIMALAFVFVFLNLASPESRTGGRH